MIETLDDWLARFVPEGSYIDSVQGKVLPKPARANRIQSQTERHLMSTNHLYSMAILVNVDEEREGVIYTEAIGPTIESAFATSYACAVAIAGAEEYGKVRLADYVDLGPADDYNQEAWNDFLAANGVTQQAA